MTQERDSLPRLLAAVPVAALRFWIRKIPAPLFGVLITLCGLTLILSPLALWVSWTQFLFKTVLAVAFLAFIIAFTLIMLGHKDQF